MRMLAAALLLLAGSAHAEPPAYIVAEITVTDSAAYARDYAAHVEPIVKAHGGRYLVRGGALEALEGAPPSPRVAILAFPSMAQARAFHASPEYAALAAIRRKYSTGRLYLVEGKPPEASPAP
jgi:uncharacterized protein (DUF1330 family)